MISPWTHRRILRKGTPGRATIVSASVPARGATSFNMAMTLQVYVEGQVPYEVEDQWMVKARDTEALNGSIPVKVDPKDPSRVAIDWDALRAEHAAAEDARRAALAAQGPVGNPDTAAAMGLLDSLGLGGLARTPGTTVEVGTPISYATAEVDARDDPELRAKLQAILGVDLVPGQSITIDGSDPALQARILQTVNEHFASGHGAPGGGISYGATAGAPAGASRPAERGGDDGDLVSRLERLTALRDAGALTPEEFAVAKDRLLDGS